jgi:uncharacterized membrane protein
MRTAVADTPPPRAESGLEPRRNEGSAASPAIATDVPKPGRWLALDLFRFCAVCLMVQGHVFSSLLDQATRSQGWYPHHNVVHGYTAPMFLFGSGLAFGYTTFRAWREHAIGGPAAVKRFKRYAWLLVIGYALHLPTISLTRLLALEEPARIATFIQVDVLQHIGVSLAFCQILVVLCGRAPRAFVSIVGALAMLFIFAAPWVWNVDLQAMGLPAWLAAYVNGQPLAAPPARTASPFPLFPWAGFTYFGILVAYAVGRADTVRSVSQRVRWPFAALAASFLVVPVLIDRAELWPWPREHDFWRTNPLIFSWRLGNILAVLSVLCFVERVMERAGWLAKAATTAGSRLAKRVLDWVKLVGAESLIIYVVHLVVLYGSVLGRGLDDTDVFRARSQGIGTATLVALGLLLAMVLLARAWNELRKVRVGFVAVQLALVGSIAYLMLTR